MQGYIALLLLIAVCCAVSDACSRSRRSNPKPTRLYRPPYDVPGPYLTPLFNKRAKYAQRMKRPLANFKKVHGLVSHSGVVVTTTDGMKYLVHKGNEYGEASETVVVRVVHMSSRWSNWGSGHNVYSSTIGDYVKAGGKTYNFFWDNCHHGSARMINLY